MRDIPQYKEISLDMGTMATMPVDVPVQIWNIIDYRYRFGLK